MKNSFSKIQISPKSFTEDDARQPEAPLWSWLDAHDIPFQIGPRLLEQRCGTTLAYPEATPHITLPGGPFEDIRNVPWETYASGQDSPALPELHTEIYGHNWRRNFDTGVKAIAADFGPPHRMGRNNAKSATWVWGRAELSCIVWPPEENTHPNTRHDALPETIGAARISIKPAWRPPVSRTMQDMVTGFERVYVDLDFAPYASYDTAAFECRPWPAQPSPGLWTTPDSPVVLLSYAERPVILPRHRIEVLNFHVTRPARGTGYLGISLQLRGPITHSYTLRRAMFDEAMIDPMRMQAQTLASVLDLPCHEIGELDV